MEKKKEKNKKSGGDFQNGETFEMIYQIYVDILARFFRQFLSFISFRMIHIANLRKD